MRAAEDFPPPPRPSPSEGGEGSKAAIALLLAAVLLAYANALLWGAFQFDDYNVIVGEPRVHSWAAWWADVGNGIRPLLKLSYTLDWTSGYGVTAFHLTNLAIHCANALLVLNLSRRYAESQPRLRDAAAPIALSAALLFALHPIHTEAVSYVSGRSASLMTMFYLLGLLAYATGCKRSPSPPSGERGPRGKHQTSGAPPTTAPRSLTLSPEGRGNRPSLQLHLLVPLCFLLALAVKETAVTFPFALLLWELLIRHDDAATVRPELVEGLRQACPEHRRRAQPARNVHLYRAGSTGNGGTLKRALRRQWSSWLLLAVVALYFLGHPGYAAHLERSAMFNSPAGNLANAALGTDWLLRQWLAPFWLNIDPDLPVRHAIDSAALPALLLLLALAATTFMTRRRRPWLAFALAWLLLQLVPLHLVLPRLDIANERQMLLAGWPLALAVAAELALRLAAHPARWRAAVAALLLLAGGLAVLRNRDYRSEIALWEATARVSPDKARVHNNLGYAYAQAGRRDEAQHEYRRALQLDPQDYKARANLARLEGSTPSPPPPL